MFPLLTDVPVRVPVPVSWRWCWLEQVWGCVAGPGGAGRPAGTSRRGAGAWHCSATPPPAPPHPHQPTGTAAVGIFATEHSRGNRSDLCGGKSVRANGKNAPYFKHRCFVFLRIQIDNHKNMKTNVKNNKYWLPVFLKRVIRFLKRALQLKKKHHHFSFQGSGAVEPEPNLVITATAPQHWQFTYSAFFVPVP